MPRRNLTFPVSVDPARVINGDYRFDNGEMADFDAQILAIETKVLAAAVGSTPTGTGFRHVTAGVEDGAATLIVNADVNAGAAIAGSKLASVLAITTAVSTGATTAATGMFRGANTVAPVLTARNGGNTADINLVSHGASDALTFGDATNAGATTFTSGAGDCVLSTGNGVIVYMAFASGNVYVSGTSLVTFSTNFVSGTGVDIVPIYNGAAQVRFGNLVTSAKLSIADNTVNSTTGVVLSVLGQNSTGTTATGGDLAIGPGTGTTANGKLALTNIITGSTVGAAGGASALPATPTGYLNIKVNGSAQRVPYYA